ncbi:hypothetical protein P5673_027454 [Acropora cervicornis]|uniref:Uncharacterized protein n=1 Tax=Acropora cervicornis TaxID=6130 RepID=A0AAD9PZ65_ACRCE|nr:hypothetical protein P5673_027454 [Acropora cervicornis]
MISSAKICSHFLAVADKERCLMEFLSKLGRNSIKTTNLCTLANTGINRDVSGKKGQFVINAQQPRPCPAQKTQQDTIQRNNTRRQAGQIESNSSREECPQFLD